MRGENETCAYIHLNLCFMPVCVSISMAEDENVFHPSLKGSLDTSNQQFSSVLSSVCLCPSGETGSLLANTGKENPGIYEL